MSREINRRNVDQRGLRVNRVPLNPKIRAPSLGRGEIREADGLQTGYARA